MRKIHFFATTLLALALSAPLAAQQSPAISTQELDAALQSHAQDVDADRSVVARVLARPDVESAVRAAGFGDDLENARAATGGLEGSTLARAAATARTIEAQLAGGQSITFTTTTIVLILLLIIIIILIAN